jgi:hypothetical protein
MQSNIENDSNSDHVSINVDSLFSKFTLDDPSITGPIPERGHNGSESEASVVARSVGIGRFSRESTQDFRSENIEEEEEDESRNWQTYSNYGGLSICPTVSDADVIEYYNTSFQGLTAEHINSRRCQ